MKQGPLILAIAVFSLSIGPGAAQAATRTVTSLNDSGGGTLRDTLAAAAAGDTIQFSVTGQIKLDSSLTITKNVTISGPGQAQLTVTRDSDGFTLFVVNTGLTVSISDISITNAKGDDFEAGGIQNAANLTLNRCIFSGNVTGAAGDGGSIENTGVLTLKSTVDSGYGVLRATNLRFEEVDRQLGTTPIVAQKRFCVMVSDCTSTVGPDLWKRHPQSAPSFEILRRAGTLTTVGWRIATCVDSLETLGLIRVREIRD